MRILCSFFLYGDFWANLMNMNIASYVQMTVRPMCRVYSIHLTESDVASIYTVEIKTPMKYMALLKVEMIPYSFRLVLFSSSIRLPSMMLFQWVHSAVSFEYIWDLHSYDRAAWPSSVHVRNTFLWFFRCTSFAEFYYFMKLHWPLQCTENDFISIERSNFCWAVPSSRVCRVIANENPNWNTWVRCWNHSMTLPSQHSRLCKSKIGRDWPIQPASNCNDECCS